MYGIDISENNGNIDLTPYRGQFVIIRAGWGWGTVDTQFHNNVQKCKNLGIPFGVYWYDYSLNESQAKQEADLFLKTIAPYKNDIKMGAWVDEEDADNWRQNHGLRISHGVIAPLAYKIAIAVENAGYYTGIYCSQSWLQYVAPECDRFDKWVASWGSNDGREQNNTSKLGTIHQYTSKPLDKDVCYVNIDIYSRNSTATTIPKIDVTGSTLDLVYRTMKNEFGYDEERKQKLGSRYNEVQNFINHIYTASVDTLVSEVWADKYGSGEVRKVVLGSRYQEVMDKINHKDKTAKIGSRIRIKAGAKDLNTGTTYASFVYNTTYTVISISGTRIVFGLNGAVTGATSSANVTVL